MELQMSTRILGTGMPCGHPFSSSQIKNIFEAKTVTSRWRQSSEIKKLFSRTKNATLKDDTFLALKSIKKHGLSPSNMVLSLPFLRSHILSEWKSHWSDSCAPELYIINQYCMERHGKPFYSLTEDCAKEDIEKNSSSISDDHELAAPSAYFTQILKDGPLSLNSLISDIFRRISECPDDKMAHHALWAVCSNSDCSLPIQYVLLSLPETSKYYDFLDWYIIEDIFEEEDCFTSHKVDYCKDLNFYNIYPSAIHSGFISVSINQFSEFIVSDIARKIFGDKEKSVYHSHQKISDLTPLIKAISRTEMNVKVYLEKYFDEIVCLALNPLEDYISEREIVGEKIKEFTGEQLKKPAYYSEFKKARESLNKKELDKLGVVIALEDKRVQSIVEKIKAALQEPFGHIEEEVQEYKSLSSNPIKHRKKLTDLLARIDKGIEHSLKNIEDADDIFNSAIVKINSILEDFEIEKEDDNDERIAALESEINRQHDELQKKQQEIEKLNKKLTEASETDSTSIQIDVVTEEINAIKSLIANNENNITPESILSSICALFPNSVEVLPSAISSAKKVPNFKQTSKMFDMLVTLISSYLPTVISGKPDSEARKCFGPKAYAANESKTVSNSSRLMKYRTFKHKNKDIVMEQHLNIGTAHDPLQTMRIYFKIIDNKIIIGYSGEHLPNN